MDDFLSNGILKEKEFREMMEKIDWSQYSGKSVLVQSCHSILPIWSYMIITSKLIPFANKVYYGDVHSPIPIFSK